MQRLPANVTCTSGALVISNHIPVFCQRSQNASSASYAGCQALLRILALKAGRSPHQPSTSRPKRCGQKQAEGAHSLERTLQRAR